MSSEPPPEISDDAPPDVLVVEGRESVVGPLRRILESVDLAVTGSPSRDKADPDDPAVLVMTGRPEGRRGIVDVACDPSSLVVAQLQAEVPLSTLLHAGPMVIDHGARTVRVNGATLDVTAKELDLLVRFVESPGRVLTRADLLSAVWNSNDTWQTAATVTEHVYRLRGKLERAGVDPACIRTLRSFGYVFDTSVFAVPASGSAAAIGERSEWRGMLTAIESLLSVSKSDDVRDLLIRTMTTIGRRAG